MIKRRGFIRWGIVGVIFTKIFNLKSSVFANDSSPKFYQVGSIDQLEDGNFLLNEDLEIGAVLVMKTEDESLIAIDPTCTHAGCFVEWESSENSFVCPCHQSKFEQDGTLIEGLAISDLVKYQVKVEKNNISVALIDSVTTE